MNSNKRIINVVKKELEITFKSVNTALLITLLPLLIVGQMLVYIYLASRFVGQDVLMNSIINNAINNLQNSFPNIISLSISEKFQLLLISQLPFYLLLIPIMIAMNITTFSIVEEKQTGTLEPLLATPVRTWELLLGKALTGAIPAVIMSWISAVLFIIGAILIVPFSKLVLVIGLAWFISLFLLVPAITMLSFILGVISSSKASDPKSAQNISVVMVLPILALIGVQIAGFVFFTPIMLFLMAIGIGIIDIAVLRLAVNLFQRESIITQWKRG